MDGQSFTLSRTTGTLNSLPPFPVVLRPEAPLVYVPAYPPYGHQLTAQKRIISKPTDPAPTDVFALLMEQGTGKTKVILDEFGYRESARDLRNMLVIAPKGVYMNWCDIEIPTHLSADLRERTLVQPWISGGGVNYKRRLEGFLQIQDRPRILVVNVEALSTVQQAVDVCTTFVGQRRTMAVVDESTVIRGIADKTERARAVIQIGQRAYARRIATGLITPRSCLDLFSQFEFLDYRILGYKSYYAFKSHYAIMKKQTIGDAPLRNPDNTFVTDADGVIVRAGGREINLVVGYKNQDELRDRIAPYSYRVLKEDCLDLPPKVYMPLRNVALTDEQHRMLKELKKTAMAQLDSGEYVTTQMKMTTLLRMHQILCGHVKDEDDVEHPVKSNRLKELMKVIDEHGGKAIIWSGFRYSIKEIIQALREEYGFSSTVHYYGDTKDADRAIAKKRFQEDNSCRFFVANQQSAGKGITLTKASLNVYYSNTQDLEDRLQSEDRAHRSGLKHSVAYVDLTAEGTMETKLIQSLRKKLDLATVITGDSYRNWII